MRILALDLDGTLITCEERQSAVLRAAAMRSGVEVDVARVWSLKREGASTKAALEALGVGVECAAEIAAHWQATIEDPAWLAIDRAFEDTHPSLDALRGTERVVLTARKHARWVRPELDRLGISSRIDRLEVVSTPEEKSAVLCALRADALIGDTEADARAALEANVPFYAVERGQRSRTFLENNGVERVQESLSEIVKLIAART